ncbi:cysteine proteinase [Rhizoclosmatium globosum]|uniref:Cysteine proteinase n=1 Tax=Rhizoclosmatium globosum TaxID=329046 RepID=A0A1Y2BX62_9FUNG|nr:cysteine proteinase [Rhizoclosmatium globosum]|eukprot:ORY39362.1 cysteine proteinase [Rhizoclosmatium globosum]
MMSRPSFGSTGFNPLHEFPALSEEHLSLYLERIGLPALVSQQAQPSLSLLNTIIYAHGSKIPFSNDLLYGLDIKPSTYTIDLITKLVIGKQGGYCLENNTLLLMALKALGFKAYAGMAKVALWSQELGHYWTGRTHTVVLVDVDDKHYVADVGFARGGVPSAIELLDGAEVNGVAGERYRLSQLTLAGNSGWLLLHKRAEWFPFPDGVDPSGDGFGRQVYFTTERYRPQDYYTYNYYVAHCPHPGIMGNLFVSVVTQTGGRAIITNKSFRRRETKEYAQLEQSIEFSSIEQVTEVMKEQFGIVWSEQQIAAIQQKLFGPAPQVFPKNLLENFPPLSNTQLQDYLNRIKLKKPSSQTLESLNEILRAQVTHIPFENAGLYFQDQKPSLVPDTLFSRLVIEKRGGYCLQLNALLTMALRALGFDASPGTSRSLLWDAELRQHTLRSTLHLIVFVKLDGVLYLCDVGMNRVGLTCAIPVEVGAVADSVLGEQHRIAASDITGPGNFILQHKRGSNAPLADGVDPAGDLFGPVYYFTLERYTPEDFDIYNWFVSHHPGEWKNSIGSRVSVTGGRVEFIDNKFRRRESEELGKPFEKSFEVASIEEFVRVWKDEFDVVIGYDEAEHAKAILKLN